MQASTLNKLIHKASDVVGVNLDSLAVVSELRGILGYAAHPLHDVLVQQRSTLNDFINMLQRMSQEGLLICGHQTFRLR